MTEADAFASVNNITRLDWSQDGVTHGELLRATPNETMTVDTCDLQFLFSGLVPDDTDPDNDHYSLGLHTDAE